MVLRYGAVGPSPSILPQSAIILLVEAQIENS